MKLVKIAEYMANRCRKVENCEIKCPFGSKKCSEIKAEDWLYIIVTAEKPELEIVEPEKVCRTCYYYLRNNICILRDENVDENSNVCAVWKQAL